MGAVMRAALSRYSADLRHSWDSLQRSLQCCGVDNYSDWLNFQDSVPCSCLATENCSSTSYFAQGCLDVAALDLAATASFLCGFISVAITTLALVLLLATWRYAAERNIHPVTPRMSS
ncbi:leukocyte surface antigen CD53-like [Schistocerca serialis cubense]|uniref:leukocyte surface antigen CD53-like n=1 Tax=Schistocerca serialis cubense TaxID=2023355 RepID=UPI00214E4A07|nr:leukocyte surface antigen CD53-like [Schistocerca serialis cubense]